MVSFRLNVKEGERYFLKCLLHHVPGAQSFEDLRTFEDTLYPTQREASIERHLLDDDREWQQCLSEASEIKTGSHLRYLFASILGFGSPTNPWDLWNEFEDHIAKI